MDKVFSFVLLVVLLGGGYWFTQKNVGYVAQNKQLTEEGRRNAEETRTLADLTRKNAEAVEEATSTIASALDATAKMTKSNKELKAAIDRTGREVELRYESTKKETAKAIQVKAEISSEVRRLELAKADFDQKLEVASKVAALTAALSAAPNPQTP